MSMADFNNIMTKFTHILAEQGPDKANAYLQGAVDGGKAALQKTFDSRPPRANDNNEKTLAEQFIDRLAAQHGE